MRRPVQFEADDLHCAGLRNAPALHLEKLHRLLKRAVMGLHVDALAHGEGDAKLDDAHADFC